MQHRDEYMEKYRLLNGNNVFVSVCHQSKSMTYNILELELLSHGIRSKVEINISKEGEIYKINYITGDLSDIIRFNILHLLNDIYPHGQLTCGWLAPHAELIKKLFECK